MVPTIMVSTIGVNSSLGGDRGVDELHNMMG